MVEASIDSSDEDIFQNYAGKNGIKPYRFEPKRRRLNVDQHGNLSKVRNDIMKINQRYCCSVTPSSNLVPSDADKSHSSVNPFKFVQPQLTHIYQEICQELNCGDELLDEITSYFFDGTGKAIRPSTVLLMSSAVNKTVKETENPRALASQRHIAMICEMIHTSSLLHDDIIDKADLRRGKPTVNNVWGTENAVLSGDYIIAVAAAMLARVRNEDVVIILSQVSLLTGADEKIQEHCYQYGRNLGIAFQLTDDILDFESSDLAMGKPTAADLKLGLATAPVLFACEKYPELNEMIMRRFSEPNDVQFAQHAVFKSGGLQQSYMLAQQHANLAIQHLDCLKDSIEKCALTNLVQSVIKRRK
ncbi:Decaprenyl-diphosphate synthase subunit 1 [Nymphon striatum]|nr:Decaprenyl-diphosphate synthase subunit 1 [Nymphon striatum]